MIKRIITAKFKGYAFLMPDHNRNITLNEILDIINLELIRTGHENNISLYLMGGSAELTELQWQGIVDESLLYYHNYTSEGHFNNAKQSGETLLESLKCYSVNPYGKRPEVKTNDMFLEYANIRKQERWDEAQANTGTWIILKEL